VSAVPVKFGEADLASCDREEIRIPGSIQPYGVMLVCDTLGFGIEQAAGDTKFMLGVDIDQLLKMSLSSVLDSDALNFIAAHVSREPRSAAPIIRLGVRSLSGLLPLDVTCLVAGRSLTVELEPARRSLIGGSDPIAHLKSLIGALSQTATVVDCCNAAARALRGATGLDRAMVYRFMPDDSGEVIVEDAKPGMQPFLGLRYPASDIPKQARELYVTNWLRSIPDVNYLPAALQPAVNPRTGEMLNMSQCTLRSVSPLHLEYLRNMGVAASLVMSVVCQGRLWGMLVLHNESPRHVSADLRIACETFAQMFSLHIEAKAQYDNSLLRIGARSVRERLVGRLMGTADIGATLASEDLLKYVAASGAIVQFEGRTHTIGTTPNPGQLTELVEWLNRLGPPLYATDHLAAQLPSAAAYPEIASGVLSLSLSREPRDFVLWFRPEVRSTVRWAGDPSKPVKFGPHGAQLAPRASFEEWRELTRQRSRPWSEVDIEAAEALRVIMLENVMRSVDAARRERENAFRRQSLLLAELDHRVKSALTKIQSLISVSRTNATSVQAFATTLQHRIQAMAQTQNLLAEGRWVGTSLRKLTDAEIAPFLETGIAPVSIAGEDVLLSPIEALAMSMVLHELLTDAVAAGTVYSGTAAVRISWSIDPAIERLIFRWEELGGAPPPLVPRAESGWPLIKRTVEAELGGSAEFEVRAAGFYCELRLPSGAMNIR
jgi:light-regulated signal transduction histidine kinase (bacteriophytochrome)